MSQPATPPQAPPAPPRSGSAVLGWLDRLNLEPQERRMVLGGLVIVALVLNYWIVWPYFGEGSKLSVELEKAERRQALFATEIGKKPGYERQM